MHDRPKRLHKPTQRPGDLIVSRNEYGQCMVSIAVMIPYETEDADGLTVISQSGRIYQDWIVFHSDKFIAGN
jgi:hypothetical protein